MNRVVRRFRSFTFLGPKGGKVRYLVDDNATCSKGRCDLVWHRIFDTFGRVYALRCPAGISADEAPNIRESSAEIHVFYGYEYTPPLLWPDDLVQRTPMAASMPTTEEKIIAKLKADYDDPESQEDFF